MASSKTFNNVTSPIWACVKATSFKEHETVYAPEGANQGTATTDTVVGTVVLGFNYNPTEATVEYTVQKKPFIVSASQIWEGIQDTIDGCSKQ